MENVRAIRISRGLSQQALAHRAGITQANVSRIEAGLLDPKYSTVLRLAYGLGVEPEDLVSSNRGSSAPASKGAEHVPA